jgi:Bax protein
VDWAEGESAVRVATFRARTAVELCQVLEEVWAGFAAGRGVPSVAPDAFPPGMERLRVDARKRAFVRSVTPYVVEENHRIAAERRWVEGVAARLGRGEDLGAGEVFRLVTLKDRYRVAGDPEKAPLEVIEELLRRVDEVPVRLALAQAALESAWGGSRMTLEGNALFGQMVFGASTGIVPRERPAGANHAVARFNGLRESVRAYMANLNSHRAYGKFRGLRARQREAGSRLDSWLLAHGLLPYSAGRAAYVDTVRELLKGHTLALLPEGFELKGPSGEPGFREGEAASALVLDAAPPVPWGGEGA